MSMIYYLATKGFTHTMETFLAHWAPDAEGRVQVLEYEQFLRAPTLPLGTYIFADLERLLPAESEIAARIWDQLHASGARLLNHPVHTLRRYDLLTKLHGLGRNRFRVARANDPDNGLRFPVFIRDESEHSGNISRLLNSHRELKEALAGAVVRGHRMDHMLVVEYIETASDDSLYRKYGAFTIGGRIVPGHMDCSQHWMVKDTDVVSSSILAEELDYLENNPDRPWLEKSFALAETGWGRMDYSRLGGAHQLWEINTNPVLILPPGDYAEKHMPTKRYLARQLVDALLALDTVAREDPVVIDVPEALFDRLETEKRKQQRQRTHRTTVRRVKQWNIVRLARRLVHPLLKPLTPFLTRNGRRY
jgi:hypothetical protein